MEETFGLNHLLKFRQDIHKTGQKILSELLPNAIQELYTLKKSSFWERLTNLQVNVTAKLLEENLDILGRDDSQRGKSNVITSQYFSMERMYGIQVHEAFVEICRSFKKVNIELHEVFADVEMWINLLQPALYYESRDSELYSKLLDILERARTNSNELPLFRSYYYERAQLCQETTHNTCSDMLQAIAYRDMQFIELIKDDLNDLIKYSTTLLDQINKNQDRLFYDEETGTPDNPEIVN